MIPRTDSGSQMSVGLECLPLFPKAGMIGRYAFAPVMDKTVLF